MAIVGRLLEAQGFRVGIIAQPDWHSTARLQAARRAEPVLRHHRRQHGFDGEPLHRGPPHPHATTPTRPDGVGGKRPDRSRHRLRAARARSVQGRADRHRRHRGEPAPHRALRLLVGEGAPLGPARREGGPARVTATPSGRSSRSRIGSRPARRSSRSPTCAARRSCARRCPTAGSRSIRRRSTRRARSRRRSIRMRWKRSDGHSRAAHDRRVPSRRAMDGAPSPGVRRRRHRKPSCVHRSCEVHRRCRRRPRARVIRMPSYEAVRDDPMLYAHASRILHLESNPGNARALVQRHGDTRRVAEPAADPADHEGDGCGLRAAVPARAASGLRRREDSRVRDDPLLDLDPARLLRRLHLLLDHRARRPHHPEPLRGLGDPRDRDDPRHGAGLHRRDLRSRRPDREHVPPRVQDRARSKSACRRPSCVYPGICPNLEHRSLAADQAVSARARAAGHQEGADRIGRALRPGDRVAGVREGAGAAPRRRLSQDRARSDRGRPAVEDDEAGRRHATTASRSSSTSTRRKRARSST